MRTRVERNELFQLVLREHSLSNTKKVVRFVGSDRKKFAALLSATCGNNLELAQRAAWALGHCEVRTQLLLHPHFEDIVDTLSKPASHPSVFRNILRLLQDYPVPENYKAPLFDICMHLLRTETEPVAVRVFAMSTAANIASDYKELKQELVLILRELMLHPQSAGLISRAKKVMRQIAS